MRTHPAQHKKDQRKIFGQVRAHLLHIPSGQQEIQKSASEYDSVAQQPECFEIQHPVGVHRKEMIPHHVQVIDQEQKGHTGDGDNPDRPLIAAEDPAEHHNDSQEGR